jgi:hypothetical protein
MTERFQLFVSLLHNAAELLLIASGKRLSVVTWFGTAQADL